MIEGPPKRVVSLVPSYTESIFDLGLGDRLVGITEYCIHPAERVAAVPKVGGPSSPNVEQIIALQPHLVIANQEVNRREDVEVLQSAGLSVWVTLPRTVHQAMELLWDMVRVFQVPERASGLVTVEKALTWTENAAAETEPVRVFCPIGSNPWMTVTADTYTSDLLRVCGGRNLFADWGDERYPTITLDDAAAMAPEVVLLPGEPFRFDETHIREIEAYPEIPAVREGRVVLVDGTLLTWPGTRLGRALQQVVHWLRPTG